MTSAKRFLEAYPNDINFVVGVHHRDGVFVTFNEDEVMITAVEGNDNYASITMSSKEFETYMQLLCARMYGLEVTQEDANFETRRVDTLSAVARR